MIEPRLLAPPLGSLLLVAAASVVLPALVVLPGWAAAARLAGRYRGTLVEPVLALVCGILVVVGVGLVLVGLRSYGPARLALVVLVLAATGLRPAARWVRRRWAEPGRRRRDLWLGGWLVVCSSPWWATAVAAGYPPADRLVWTYAVIGRQLAEAGGIPASVSEWGLSLRWLPDYLAFNLVSGAYEGVFGFVPAADALAAWRVPIVLLGLSLAFAVLRLWLSAGPALAGTALFGGSLAVLAKFNAYKPEALGIVLGLAALWLVVAGLRHRRLIWIVLAGLLLGLDLAVHAIAATVLGLVVAGVAAAEWGSGIVRGWRGGLSGRAGRPVGVGARVPIARTLVPLGWLTAAALAGLLLSMAVGVVFQGRPLVASAAFEPTLVDGRDPTWTFFLRSTGDFREPEPPRPVLPLARGVTTPWEGLNVASGTGWWFLAAVGVGVFFLLARRRWRDWSGVVGWALAAGLVGLGMAFFALRFETYVPRWTGLVRFGQYMPVFAAVGAAFAVEGGRTAWLLVADGGLRAAARRWLGRGVAVGAAIWLSVVAGGHFERDAPRLQPAGERALAVLARLGAPGDVVLSNALTPGTIEFFTGLEAPLEGRQPLIEEPAVLAAANELLLRAHRFWAGGSGPDEGSGPGPADGAGPAGGAVEGLLDALRVRWLLVADDPGLLGASAGLGGSVAALGDWQGIDIVWAADGVAIARVERDGASGGWSGGAPGSGSGGAPRGRAAADGRLAALAAPPAP